ncbi:hypothetical protein K469DRAFT_750195 [Zopfia rhizophila CBS 207.26]|uniref:Uncharacterized protein n=1 Tax=Zopfia rhizophila CBS 207.26 TaxID=1314779 RepID=A0A6A6E437_9PEZI|nr:hypothetical protein K469DRAFT_750195 [Zopfia rhizophila CBS 207.26]
MSIESPRTPQQSRTPDIPDTWRRSRYFHDCDNKQDRETMASIAARHHIDVATGRRWRKERRVISLGDRSRYLKQLWMRCAKIRILCDGNLSLSRGGTGIYQMESDRCRTTLKCVKSALECTLLRAGRSFERRTSSSAPHLDGITRINPCLAILTGCSTLTRLITI